MSPSWSSTNRADVPGRMSLFTSVTKSSPIPVDINTVAEPADPTIAPIAAPTTGTPSTRPARKPTAEQPRMFGANREPLAVERERSIAMPYDHCHVLE